MIEALKKEGNGIKRLVTCEENFCDKSIEDFISASSGQLFQRFGLPDDFLKEDPSLWENHPQYKKGQDLLLKLKVANDVAERAVKITCNKDDLKKNLIF